MFNFMLNVFQSTLPREERPSIPPATPTIIDFNPRSHERSDSFTTALSMYLTISIHAPTRGATLLQIGSYIIISISIHAPTRGATKISNNNIIYRIFQSTLPREERHNHSCIIKTICIISIHAPTRGATKLVGVHADISDISIHAPTRGATSFM